MRLGRYQDAVTANGNALRLLGATALREANLGEALVNAANGIVTAQAKAAFDRALALDPKDVATRFYLGLAAEQDGRGPEAVKIWRGLLAEAPPGAPWREMVQGTLARIAGDAAPSVPGPSQQDMAAAGPDARAATPAVTRTSPSRRPRARLQWPPCDAAGSDGR